MNILALDLPYPLSANRYWATRVIKASGTRAAMAITYVTKEAESYKQQVALLCRAAGIRAPLAGRVNIDIKLYPARPQDWLKRMRVDGGAWDDTVRCIDLDNANKVLLDALKGIAIEDDKWVRKIVAERMEPDASGARVVVTITTAAPIQMQASLYVDSEGLVRREAA